MGLLYFLLFGVCACMSDCRLQRQSSFPQKPDVGKLDCTARSRFCCLFVPLANSHYSSLIVYIFFFAFLFINSCSIVHFPLFLFLSKAIIVISGFLLSFFYLIPGLILVLTSSLHFLLVLTHRPVLHWTVLHPTFFSSPPLCFFLQKPRVSFFSLLTHIHSLPYHYRHFPLPFQTFTPFSYVFNFHSLSDADMSLCLVRTVLYYYYPSYVVHLPTVLCRGCDYWCVV